MKNYNFENIFRITKDFITDTDFILHLLPGPQLPHINKFWLWSLAPNVAKSTQLIQHKFILFKCNIHLKILIII